MSNEVKDDFTLIPRLTELQEELHEYAEEQRRMGSKVAYRDMVTVFFLLKLVQLEQLIYRK